MCFDILWLKAPSSTLRTSFILQKNRTMKANPAAQSRYAATRWQRRPNHGPLVPREVPLRVGPAAHTAEGRAPARFPKCAGSPAAPGPLGQQEGRARGRGRRRHARATGTFLRTGSGLVSHTHTHLRAREAPRRWGARSGSVAHAAGPTCPGGARAFPAGHSGWRRLPPLHSHVGPG